MVLAASGASSTSKTLQASPSTLHMGLDGYVWWIGIVENRKDPLKLGRAQVRIHAWHTADKAAMPTETLPWAQAVQPINATHGNVVPPKEGTTVVGFFMDGKEGQIPVMTGILNGIPSEKVPSSKGFSDPGTDLESRPKLPGQQQASTYPVKINEPMTINLARNEMLEGANSYIDIRNITRAKSVTTATALIPDVSSLAKSFTLPSLSTLQLPEISDLTGALEGELNNAVSGLQSQVTGQIASAQAQLQQVQSIADNVLSIPDNLDTELQNIVNDLNFKSLSSFIPKSEPTWEEPPTPYDADYPYNIVSQTESGHVTEIDDSPGAERIHVRHRTGTYDEMQPDGSRVTHVFGNNYHIVAKDENVTISGVCNITINGDANLYVKKNLRQVVEGDAVMEFKKNLRVTVGENFIIENGKDFVHGAGGTQTWSSNIYTFK